jgi:ditrans,polycis-polyprenyl diphosphate synthase
LEGLFALIEAKLIEYRNGKDRLRVIGDIDLFPTSLKKIIAEANLKENNEGWDRFTLNVALGYTSRAEISAAIQDVTWGAGSALIREDDVRESLLESCFWSSSMTPIDLLIRTSGEMRLSDFMLWQAGYVPLIFEQILWPEISFWNLLRSVVAYQKSYEILRARRVKLEKMREDQAGSLARIKDFQYRLQEKRRNHWNHIVDETSQIVISTTDLDQKNIN